MDDCRVSSITLDAIDKCIELVCKTMETEDTNTVIALAEALKDIALARVTLTKLIGVKF